MLDRGGNTGQPNQETQLSTASVEIQVVVEVLHQMLITESGGGGGVGGTGSGIK